MMGAFLAVSACQTSDNADFVAVYATVETVPVDAAVGDDAADDPAVWFNAEQPSESRILGSDKKRGLEVFHLDGTRDTTDAIGRINNIDVRLGFPTSTGPKGLVGGSHRDQVGLVFWSIDAQGIRRLRSTALKSQLEDVYGFCLYHSNGTFYAFVNSKTGDIEQWELTATGDSIDGKRVRTLHLGGQVEGMVADDALGTLFVGVEDEGIYRFDALPTGSSQPTLLEASTAENPAIAYDVEGLALYAPNDSTGYLVASSQGNNSYAVFERTGKHAYVGSFTVGDGTVDGTSETDGIEIAAFSFGESYPAGIFIAQDGANTDGTVSMPQNFKVVSWAEIAQALLAKKP
jgi:3-phytase